MELLVTGEPQDVVIAPESVVEEITQNVRMIVTTPKGTLPLDRDFGLNFDLVDKPMPFAKLEMEVEIVRQVGKYEPRARVVQVTWQKAETEAMDGRAIPIIRIDTAEQAE
jgi:phage baseplate assembly protein W